MNVTLQLSIPSGITLGQLRGELFRVAQFDDSPVHFSVNSSATLTVRAAREVPEEK